jgi:arabinose-5-phosphate isomerase
MDNNHYDNMIGFLKSEADAITKSITNLAPAQVQQLFSALLGCSGKIVLSGIGKSGIVARKVAATLTSTGNLGIYLHPSDALHGDFGIVAPGDLIILISNSGETEELLTIIPHLKNRQIPIISILGNVDSTLAKQSDIFLDASVDNEACPLNLAPTTSTTVALAIGDAIAMTLMQSKGLTPEDFALNHPGGRLGKRLTLKVSDLMRKGQENPIILPTATWLELITAITQGGVGVVNIIDTSSHLLGIITDGDLRRTLQKTDPMELGSLTSGTIMTPNPIVVSPDCLAYNALQLMENRSSQISVMPVVDDQGICLGMIRLHDMVRSGL